MLLSTEVKHTHAQTLTEVNFHVEDISEVDFFLSEKGEWTLTGLRAFILRLNL